MVLDSGIGGFIVTSLLTFLLISILVRVEDVAVYQLGSRIGRAG